MMKARFALWRPHSKPTLFPADNNDKDCSPAQQTRNIPTCAAALAGPRRPLPRSLPRASPLPRHPRIRARLPLQPARAPFGLACQVRRPGDDGIPALRHPSTLALRAFSVRRQQSASPPAAATKKLTWWAPPGVIITAAAATLPQPLPGAHSRARARVPPRPCPPGGRVHPGGRLKAENRPRPAQGARWKEKRQQKQTLHHSHEPEPPALPFPSPYPSPYPLPCPSPYPHPVSALTPGPHRPRDPPGRPRPELPNRGVPPAGQGAARRAHRAGVPIRAAGGLADERRAVPVREREIRGAERAPPGARRVCLGPEKEDGGGSRHQSRPAALSP